MLIGPTSSIQAMKVAACADEPLKDFCFICSTDETPKIAQRTIPCGHKFCTRCLVKNLAYSIANSKECICPMCRNPIFNESEESARFRKKLITRSYYQRELAAAQQSNAQSVQQQLHDDSIMATHQQEEENEAYLAIRAVGALLTEGNPLEQRADEDDAAYAARLDQIFNGTAQPVRTDSGAEADDEE